MRLSASKRRLLRACQWWARPEVDGPEPEPGRPALMGTALAAMTEHGGADMSVPGVAEKLDALTDSEQETVLEWWTQWQATEWAQVPWRNEVAFAYDVASDTARELTTNGHRDYSSLTAGEVPGTADLVHIEDGVVWIADQKTGFQGNLEPVAQHAQLRFLALAACRAYLCDRARIVLLHLDGEEVLASAADLDADELDAIAAEVRAEVATIPGSAPKPGAHCADLYCPALAVCPHTKALATHATAAITLRPEWLHPVPTTDEHALFLRDGARALEKLAEAWEAAARAYADVRNGIINPATGKVWAAREVSVERIALNGPGGAEAIDLLDRLAPGAAERKVQASKTAAREAFGKTHGLTGKALDEAFEAQVLVPLRVMGAVSNQSHMKWQERKIK